MAYAKGNSKLGSNIYTYSRPPISTCPGASNYCKSVCYANSIYKRWPNVRAAWNSNSHEGFDLVDELDVPKKAKVIRFHVGGDFDSSEYILRWVNVVKDNTDKLFFGYTRSWRVPHLINYLELLRKQPNVQLFASVDSSINETPPAGWRIAYIDNITHKSSHVATLECLEQSGKKASCEDCRYCFVGRKGNVLFREH